MPVMTSFFVNLPLALVAFASAETLTLVQDKNATAHAVKQHEAAPHTISVLQRKPATIKAPPEGQHFLGKPELKPIDSIRCLQEKQRNPKKPCSDPKGINDQFVGPINMGHFPHWKDDICHSDGELFCDPSGLLNYEERRAAQKRLQLFKERTMVNCGMFAAGGDPHAEHWYDEQNGIHYGRLGLEDHRPFNLAVVVADEWPSNEMDPKSIEYFGGLIMAQWGLMPIYNGVDNGERYHQLLSHTEQVRNCPHTALLIVLPKYHEAFISSPSCEFICPSRGGPEVIAATLAGLDRGGVKEAILSGIDEIGKVLESTIALSVKPVQNRWRGSNFKEHRSEKPLLWTLRIFYIAIIAFAVFCSAAFVYYIVLPQKDRSYRSYYSMTGQNGRRFIQESLQAEG